MTTPRVQRHRQAEANRRGVTTRGKRVQRPRNIRPSHRTAKRTGATVGVLGLLTAICSFGGAVFTVAGAVTTAVGGVTVAWIEYRRDLIEVKRTGKPIGQPEPPKPAEPVKPEPPERNLAHPPLDARKPPAHKPTSKGWPPKGHNPKCRAKSAKTCRCPKGRTGAKRRTA